MGVEPYLVASSVSAVLAQRLVRVLCPHCKRRAEGADIRELPVHARPAPGEQFFMAGGCAECRQTGYLGRHAICELLPLDDRIRMMITGSASAVEIRLAAQDAGWRPLFQDGWRLVRAGVTSPREVLRVSRDATSDLDAPVMAPSEGGL
jgi:type II secretory ATPase GspE/PulE/Tfp pilus assembly ATPase PilB-like protein